MPTAARPEAWPETRAFPLGLLGIALVTLWRLLLLPLDSADLFVDDAQYWFWGQELAWGYYSKPPLIAWLLRLTTSIGSDAPFWIRVSLPLIHAASAVVVSLIARRLFDARVGAVAGLAFVTMPAAAVGSLLVSTDTPMLLCFATAMLAHLHLATRRSVGWAIVLGAAIGTGFLAKYAMIYFPLSAALVVLFVPQARIAWRDAAIAGAIAVALVAPNLAWNATNQFATLHHTADNANFRGVRFDPKGLAGFIGEQFLFAGPVIFAGYLMGLARLGSPQQRYLALMSLPVLLIVSTQALISEANGNWAAAGHLAVTVLAAATLITRPRLLATGLAINLAVTAALPIAAIYADRWQIGDNLVLERYVGQAALSEKAAEIARAEGIDTLVSDTRAIVADFFYTLRDSGLRIYAEPTTGFPPHHYAQRHPLPPGEGDVLFVAEHAPTCRTPDVTPELVAAWIPALGYRTDEVQAYRVSRRCWFPD